MPAQDMGEQNLVSTLQQQCVWHVLNLQEEHYKRVPYEHDTQ